MVSNDDSRPLRVIVAGGSLSGFLTGEFFIDEMMVTAAIERKSSFNVIHLDTMQKTDSGVMFWV